jgi:hypothetical protein
MTLVAGIRRSNRQQLSGRGPNVSGGLTGLTLVAGVRRSNRQPVSARRSNSATPSAARAGSPAKRFIAASRDAPVLQVSHES